MQRISGMFSTVSAREVALSLAGEAPALDVLRRFDPAAGQLPESLTMDRRGNLFLSMSNFIAKLTPSGDFTRYATLPLPQGALALGVKFGPDGCLYCASGGFAAEPAAAFVWRISGVGEVEPFAAFDAAGFPNDLAFDARGFMYVTEPFLGRIYRVDPCGVSDIWLEHPWLCGDPLDPALAVHAFGADGIAFDAAKRNLYVGNLDLGAIVCIPLTRDSSAGEPRIFVQSPLLKGADGLAFDREGTLYVAVNGQDRLVSISKSGEIRVLAEGLPLDAPSSLVFGRRAGRQTTLYISSFAINRATGAHAGAPEPALLAFETHAPGLGLF